jgi:hypothetical protein
MGHEDNCRGVEFLRHVKSTKESKSFKSRFGDTNKKQNDDEKLKYNHPKNYKN